jgi:L-alanine-DL-glutamate epimerase-like enolase superfamily enzyme
MKRRTFLSSLGAAALAPNVGIGEPEKSPLDEHRIASVGFRKVKTPWPRLVGKNARLGVHGRGPSPSVVILKTDQGAMGWGLGGPQKRIEAMRARLVGSKVSALIDPAIGIRADELRGLDIALHDLAGVIFGVPVWKMLGGGEKPKLTKIYSGMIYFDDLEPEDKPAGIGKLLENCRRDRDYGYRQLKVKIGRGNRWMKPEAGLKRDIEVVKAIAKDVPDCAILVDGNNGFNADSFIRFLDGIDGTPLFWIEEPFHETLADWRKLAKWARGNGYEKTLLADGEATPDKEVLDQLGREKILQVRLEDIMGLGFTPWRKWMPELAAQGVQASPHTWGCSLKTVYTAHLVGAFGNAPTVEGVTSGDKDVDFGENRIAGGQFVPSSGPGFGMRIRGM